MNTNNKYLSPYKRIHGSVIDEGYIRHYIGGSGGFMVWKSYDGFAENIKVNWRRVLNVSGFHSLDAAKEHLDKELIEKGYIFLTDEQFEKYQLLL